MTNAQKNPPEVLGDMFPRCEKCDALMQRSASYPRGMLCLEGCGRIFEVTRESACMIPDDSERGQKLAAAANLPLLLISTKKRRGRRVYVARGERCVRCPEAESEFSAVRVTSVGSVHIENARRIEPAQEPVMEAV